VLFKSKKYLAKLISPHGSNFGCLFLSRDIIVISKNWNHI
jgi:hypothetical protein